MNPELGRKIATVFGLGHLRPAPGTWASAAAIPVGYLLHATLGFPGFLVVTLLVVGLGYFAVTAALEGRNDDPQEFVIDEVVGQWVALLSASAGFWQAGLDPWTFPWPGWVSAFLLFRLFDIWKPGPVGWADRKPGALGVMLDDVIAGALAALGVMVLAGIAHGIVGV